MWQNHIPYLLSVQFAVQGILRYNKNVTVWLQDEQVHGGASLLKILARLVS